MTDAAPVSPAEATDSSLDRMHVRSSLPFIAFHLLTGLVFVTGVKWEWVLLAFISYFVRMFAVTAGYHRYFSHRAFKTTRVFQFVLAWLAQMSAQKGVLWWAAHHRHHHRHSDTEHDIHSPRRRGFWWSHLGWFLARRYEKTNYNAIKDFARFPELVWLNEYFLVPPLVGLALAWLIGGLPGVVWAGIVPTVLLWHGTFSINSLSHVFGKRRYLTPDDSRNSFLLALITCGEGWHNNHHYFQNTANQGWFWWEIDVTFYALKVLSLLGLVSDLRLASAEAKFYFRRYSQDERLQLKTQSSAGSHNGPALGVTVSYGAQTPKGSPVVAHVPPSQFGEPPSRLQKGRQTEPAQPAPGAH